MKKLFALLLASMMVLALAACGGTPAPASSGVEAGGDGNYEIAMITDLGNIDDQSFNQGTWEGIKAYAEANGITHQYYKPAELSDAAYLDSIDLAIKGGAKVVIAPGFLFSNAIGDAQAKYPEVCFIQLDASPTGGPADNAVGITFMEEQPGYLAGYAAVKDGYTKLGFMGGMAVPAVVRYGFGFVQGANAAAEELGVKVEIKYHYTGGFEATPDIQAMAATWYSTGTEVIFACGGSLCYSVFAAADAENGKVIGVDVDQAGHNDNVITSAMKGLAESVNQMLTAFYADEFPGGQDLLLGAADNAVGLPMATSKFETFTEEEYDTVFAAIAAGEIEIAKDTDAAGEPIVSPLEMEAEFASVTVDYIE